MTAKQYAAIRKKEQQKKESNYKRNVAKAGVFEDYTDWYTKRGTDTKQSWAKNKNTLGHRMAKTKFDWSGKKVAATTTAAVEVNTRKKRLGKKWASYFSRLLNFILFSCKSSSETWYIVRKKF